MSKLPWLSSGTAMSMNKSLINYICSMHNQGINPDYQEAAHGD